MVYGFSLPAFRPPRDAVAVIFIRYVTQEKRDNGKNRPFRAYFCLKNVFPHVTLWMKRIPSTSNPPQIFVPSFNRIPIHKTHNKGEIMKSKHLFLGCLAVLSLAASQAFAQEKSTVYPGVDLEPSGNPIFTDAWTCDPAPLVVGDRLYVYTGEDIYKDG